MKYFLAIVTIIDGEHEHTGRSVFKGRNQKAVERALQELVDSEDWFTWGDGLAEVKKWYLREIPKTHFKVLERYL